MHQISKPAPVSPPRTRYRSRRKPLLRVVGDGDGPVRHAIALKLEVFTEQIYEVFTFSQWRDLPRSLRPKNSWLLPGLGFLVIRAPISKTEAVDVRDVAEQAAEDWRAERGID